MLQGPLLGLHPLCGGGDLLFLSPQAAAGTAAFRFCSHTKTPARIISKYLEYAYCPWGICLVILFAYFSFFNNLQDVRQHPLSLASLISFMFDLEERPYPGRALISFWCDSDNKNFDF